MQASASKLPYVADVQGRPASQTLCPAVRVLEWKLGSALMQAFRSALEHYNEWGCVQQSRCLIIDEVWAADADILSAAAA